MNVFQKHQLAIAKRTLRMTPTQAFVAGGMTFEEAYEIVYKTPLKRRLATLIAEYGMYPPSLHWELGNIKPGDVLGQL